jgi:hypothetical protein
MSGTIRLRGENVEWREVDGEVVALDVRASTYFVVNHTGAAIWPRLVAGATHAELVTEIRDRYCVADEDAARHVDEFLESLREKDLLET